MDGERDRLERIAADSWYARGPNAVMIEYCATVFARTWHGNSCLELGPAEGLMTEALRDSFPDLTLVDGSRRFVETLRARFPGASVVHSLFEELRFDRTFDTIVLSHVLEHVVDPVQLLRKAASWLAPGGEVYAAVPNANSLHRRAAVLMGLLPNVHGFSPADVHHGHRRVYDSETLGRDFRRAGLEIRKTGGFWLKPVSDAQIEAGWTPEMLAAFMKLGEEYPDLSAELYVIAHARK